MTNAFDWRGKPSIFTKPDKQGNFTGLSTMRSMKATDRPNFSNIALPGSAKNLPPEVIYDDSDAFMQLIKDQRKKIKDGRKKQTHFCDLEGGKPSKTRRRVT